MTSRELESARGWAVHHEQAATEYGRRVTQALAYLEEMACECGFGEFTFGRVQYTCAKCELQAILWGDK